MLAIPIKQLGQCFSKNACLSSCPCLQNFFHALPGPETTFSKTFPLNPTQLLLHLQRELISSIQLKLQALWEERELILSEVKAHAEHGTKLESLVQDLCKPNEYERYMMFIGDLEKVVSLLLCLSSRLARVQNAMEKIDENTDAEEKVSPRAGAEGKLFYH